MKETLSLRSGMSVRQRQLIFAVIAGCFIFGILVWGTTMPESAYAVDYGQKNLVPSAAHPFGTDHMGRDMLLRSVKGMSISLQIGIAAAFVSSCIALLLGTLSAAFGGKVDQFVLWLVDLCMGVPHILLILMISVMMGGGIMGVSVGVIVTHWPRLTRVIRAEGISFLGYGLPLDMPAIGIILSESMRYLALGMWWLAFFPGFLLLLVVLIFDRLGAALRDLFDPQFGQE